MADVLDQAQELQELFLEKALEEHHKNTLKGDSLEFCEECDDEIPEKRREILKGVRTCVDCASLADKTKRF